MKKPLTMREIHDIRRRLAREWENKSKKEIERERTKIRVFIKKIGLGIE